jgi:hypothetical protein
VTFGLPAPRTSGPLWKKLAAQQREKVKRVPAVPVPIDEPVAYPTARQIAVAIISACRLVGGDPEACAYGMYHVEGRGLAYVALCGLFDRAPREYLATVLGRRKEKQAVAFVRKMERCVGVIWWWKPETIEAVIDSVRRDELLPPKEPDVRRD